MSEAAARAIAVIGGGFSGAVCALHLARLSPVALTITVYEPRPLLGAGIAYSTRDPAHRINVPAAKMVVFAEDPDDFVRWLQERDALAGDPEAVRADGSLYPQRGLFGDYIADRLAGCVGRHPGTRIQHVQDRVQALSPNRAGFALRLDGQNPRHADLVVLATSHPPPSVPAPLVQGLAGDPRLIADPWRPDALLGIPGDDAVLIVGTGLSMADVVATLDRQNHRGKITIFSRHGLISRGHALGPLPAAPASERIEARTARDLLRQVRGRLAVARRQGLPWQPIIDAVRAQGQTLWAGLDRGERRRLLRHVRPWWDVHRYRLAPPVEALLQRKLADGSLTCRAAHLIAAAPYGQRIAVQLRGRGLPATASDHLLVDRVIVTTGPAHGSVLEQNPALASLAQQGLLISDGLGLGIAVTARNETISLSGATRPNLRIVGPLARGRYGELMGLPQLSDHAQRVATEIVEDLVSAEKAG